MICPPTILLHITITFSRNTPTPTFQIIFEHGFVWIYKLSFPSIILQHVKEIKWSWETKQFIHNEFQWLKHRVYSKLNDEK